MPELPEVETVRAGLQGAVAGKTIARVTLRRKDLRVPFPPGFAVRLAGRKILSVTRRAKYLLFHLSGGEVLIAHLGMSGRFTSPACIAGSGHNKHDHVVFTFSDGEKLIYNDARRFGLMTLCSEKDVATHKLFAHLGPEPLEKDFSARYLKEALGRRKGPVKAAIMDQALVVGVGNIYASEALFLAKIHPQAPAAKAADRAPALVSAIRRVLREAIASGGSSLRDFVRLSGEAGYFQHRFNVYARAGKPCVACGIPLRSIRLAGRSTFFCPKCQSK